MSLSIDYGHVYLKNDVTSGNQMLLWCTVCKQSIFDYNHSHQSRKMGSLGSTQFELNQMSLWSRTDPYQSFAEASSWTDGA